jgi:hypothetical protein
MSDTPRTDAVEKQRRSNEITDAPALDFFVPADFARQLEREIRELERENLEVREVLGKMLDEGIGEHAMRAIAKFALRACRLADRTLSQK